jgi:hypothetical protein
MLITTATEPDHCLCVIGLAQLDHELIGAVDDAAG